MCEEVKAMSESTNFLSLTLTYFNYRLYDWPRAVGLCLVHRLHVEQGPQHRVAQSWHRLTEAAQERLKSGRVPHRDVMKVWLWHCARPSKEREMTYRDDIFDNEKKRKDVGISWEYLIVSQYNNYIDARILSIIIRNSYDILRHLATCSNFWSCGIQIALLL